MRNIELLRSCALEQDELFFPLCGPVIASSCSLSLSRMAQILLDTGDGREEQSGQPAARTENDHHRVEGRLESAAAAVPATGRLLLLKQTPFPGLGGPLLTKRTQTHIHTHTHTHTYSQTAEPWTRSRPLGVEMLQQQQQPFTVRRWRRGEWGWVGARRCSTMNRWPVRKGMRRGWGGFEGIPPAFPFSLRGEGVPPIVF